MPCRQTQPAHREYHTQYYVVAVQTLVELNPNILVRDVERMCIVYNVKCALCSMDSAHCVVWIVRIVQYE